MNHKQGKRYVERNQNEKEKNNEEKSNEEKQKLYRFRIQVQKERRVSFLTQLEEQSRARVIFHFTGLPERGLGQTCMSNAANKTFADELLQNK
jgi:hypothetical protein